MKTLRYGFCVFAFSMLASGLLVPELKAAGPATIQQSVSQIQSSLTDASVGCRRCWYRRGFAVGYGYGAYGYPYYGGYGYYGGYSGWGYSRPVVYSYPVYSNYYYSRPAYYTGYYGYSPSLSSCNCGGYTYSSYQPSIYTTSNYSYPTQAVTYGTSAYSSPTIYSTPTYTTYGQSNPVYTPSYTSPSVISSPTPIAPSTNSVPAPTPAPAPYPAPPVEYTQPSAYRVPVATAPVQTASSTPLIVTPSYSASIVLSDAGRTAYSPVSYNYAPGNTLVNRLYSSGSPW